MIVEFTDEEALLVRTLLLLLIDEDNLRNAVLDILNKLVTEKEDGKANSD